MKKGNGSKSFEELVLERFDESDRKFDRLSQAVAEGFLQVNLRIDGLSERVDRLTNRVDGLVETFGGHWRDHERRLTALELAQGSRQG